MKNIKKYVKENQTELIVSGLIGVVAGVSIYYGYKLGASTTLKKIYDNHSVIRFKTTAGSIDLEEAIKILNENVNLSQIMCIVKDPDTKLGYVAVALNGTVLR